MITLLYLSVNYAFFLAILYAAELDGNSKFPIKRSESGTRTDLGGVEFSTKAEFSLELPASDINLLIPLLEELMSDSCTGEHNLRKFLLYAECSGDIGTSVTAEIAGGDVDSSENRD